jgi:NADPH:quinone reductase-like Zn-dependent oxidoreductase
MACDKKDFEWGLEQVKQKIIRPVLDISLPLCDAAEAHRLIANNEVAGNIVLRPWAE